MLRTIRILATGTAVVYLALCGYLYFFQRSLLYYPVPRLNFSAATMTLPANGADLIVSTRAASGAKALLYFGGNAEDVSSTLPSIAAAFPEHAIFASHYRGYGGSAGSPSEQALFADALVLYDHVQREHPHIEVIGRSLGSGVAVYLASQRPVERLMLVTPYNSVADLAAAQYPFFPIAWILQDKFESWKYAPRITAPTLLIAAERDEIVPRASTERLRSHFANNPVYRVLPGGHNTVSENRQYSELLAHFHAE